MKPGQALRTLLSLLLYAGIYYLIFRDLKSIALLLAVIILHESGHFVAMRIFGYANVKMLFIPLFGAFVSGQPGSTDAGRKMIVLFAGPIPGIILGMVSAFIYTLTQQHIFYQLALMFIFLNAFNLLPLTPMDGGQMLEVLFPEHSIWVQTLFIVLSAIAIALVSYFTRNYLLVFLILLLFYRFISIWKKVPANQAEKKDAGPVHRLGVLPTLLYTLIWLVFMVLPMITLYRIS
jgi:stage IV sporulation protein FB